MSIVSQLKEYANMANIAEEAKLDQDELQKIGNRVKLGFDEDYRSMQDWLADVKKVEELAALACKKKNYPLPNSANIKYPLITKACYEFSSRTYPEIIKDGKVVKARVIGLDFTQEKQDRAQRVSDYMNYQLLFEHEDWELELDRLLNLISLIGFICKKTYYDPVRKVIRSEICDYKDLIINSETKSLGDARRISHVIHVRLNDLIESVNAKVYCSEPVDKLMEQLEHDELDKEIDLIEQHTYLDLDDDNYLEPYIVTILKDTSEILRIAPRFTKDTINGSDDNINYIDPIQIFTDYHFLVSPKGKFQSVGFGILMLHLNETINTILNQLVDAGQLANLQGGYKDSRLKNMGSGDSLHNPGEWKTVKAMAGMTLKDGIMPIQYKEPSSVLYQLLGLLIGASKDLSSSSEVLTGASSADNAKSGAVMALIQEGLKVFTSIQRRIYRSLTNEFKKIYTLDSIYADEKKYFTLLDDNKYVMREDFELKSLDILPVADPNLSSDLQRASRNQIFLAAQQLPGANKIKLTEHILKNSNLGVPIDELMLPPEAMNQPDPAMLKLQADIQHMSDDVKLRAEALDIQRKQAEIELYKVQCQCLELKAKAMLEVAQAQAQQDNGKFQEYQMQLDILSKHMDAMQGAAEYAQANQHHVNEMNMRQQELDQNQQEIDTNAQSSETVAPESSDSASV